MAHDGRPGGHAAASRTASATAPGRRHFCSDTNRRAAAQDMLQPSSADETIAIKCEARQKAFAKRDQACKPSEAMHCNSARCRQALACATTSKSCSCVYPTSRRSSYFLLEASAPPKKPRTRASPGQKGGATVLEALQGRLGRPLPLRLLMQRLLAE